MLHLILQSPIEAAILERIDTGDSVVFLENAVLRILQNGNLGETLAGLLTRNHLYVLSDELTVRGIRADELVTGIEVIDYAGLVELTVRHPLIQTWS
jgi:sulfur relay protein TusB/DsrH